MTLEHPSFRKKQPTLSSLLDKRNLAMSCTTDYRDDSLFSELLFVRKI